MNGLFQYQQIASMNERELAVYRYVSSHLEETSRMNIRELAAASRVSTTTVMRFCGKVGCGGYTEFQYHLQKALKKQQESEVYVSTSGPAVQYLLNMAGDAQLNEKLEEAASWCRQARQVLFVGEGVSGTMGEYGARLFSSAGLLAFAITDPYYPPPVKDMTDVVVFVLSVSGENENIISFVNSCRKRRMKVISITNTDQCTTARISGINFAYYMPLTYLWPEVQSSGLTTQLPVVGLLERLSGKLIRNDGTEPGRFADGNGWET